MAGSSPSPLRERREGDGITLALSGEWDIRSRPPGFAQVESLFAGSPQPKAVAFDTVALERYDSSLISLLLQVHRQCDETGAAFRRETLPKEINELLDMALARWFDDYNRWKPHQAREGETPWECYRPAAVPPWRMAA